MKNKKPLGYVGGGIMTYGEQLARQSECDKMEASKLNVQYYSPAQNKSINDKSNMTEEENNHLAEKICEADVDRLWNSDFTVMCPEQSAIGTMCETGILYGWRYMCDKLITIVNNCLKEDATSIKCLEQLLKEILRIQEKQNFFHYFDIRTNHLNEKDWRRSFSINQFLYGAILYSAADHQLHNSFNEILPKLKELYGEVETDE